MYIIFSVIAALLLLFSLILFPKIRLVIGYKKDEGEKFFLDFSFYIFGKKFSKKNIPYSYKKNHEKTDEKLSEEKSTNAIKKIKNFAESISIVKKTYSKNKKGIKKAISAEKIDVCIKFGMFDAMQTGIATGVVWALLYNSLALVSTIGTVYEHEFQVEPIFDKPYFCLNGKCIFSFRLINIICVTAKIYITYKRLCKKCNSRV